MPYTAVYLEAFDWEGRRIYHTDCLLTIVHDFALVCLEAIKDPKIKELLLSALTNKTKPFKIIDLSF